MSVRGLITVTGVEWSKLAGQLKARLLILACATGPFVFAAALAVQSSLPEDTLFGRSVKESGFALPLVVLGFAALWVLPAVASIVGGDVFSAEDRYGTWTTVLTRSRSRAEVFGGKVLATVSCALIAIAALGVSSMAAGLIVVGSQPLIDLSGGVLSPADAWVRVALAWASALPPAIAFTGLAVMLSVLTRSSAAGTGLPVVLGLTMQLLALVDGPEPLRRVLIVSAFEAWHGLLTEPRSYAPLVHGTVISSAYILVCLVLAYRTLQRRDVGG